MNKKIYVLTAVAVLTAIIILIIGLMRYGAAQMAMTSESLSGTVTAGDAPDDGLSDGDTSDSALSSAGTDDTRTSTELARDEALDATRVYIQREPPVYYDLELSRLVAEPESAFTEITGNYLYNEYTAVCDAYNWKRRRIPVKDDAFVQKIVLDGSSVTLHCKRGLFAEYGTDGDTAYAQLVDPRDRYDKIVVIDPGHGGDDEGAIIERVNEKDINLGIIGQLTEIFDLEGTLLLPTRTDDIFITLEDRYALANSIGDYFISVHNNVDEHSTRTHGTVTYFQTHDSDAPITSKELAQVVQTALSERLSTRDRGIVQSEDDYRVLVNTIIPAVITEVMFMTHDDERERLTDPDCQTEIAHALYEAIKALPSAR